MFIRDCIILGDRNNLFHKNIGDWRIGELREIMGGDMCMCVRARERVPESEDFARSKRDK